MYVIALDGKRVNLRHATEYGAYEAVPDRIQMQGIIPVFHAQEQGETVWRVYVRTLIPSQGSTEIIVAEVKTLQDAEYLIKRIDVISGASLL